MRGKQIQNDHDGTWVNLFSKVCSLLFQQRLAEEEDSLLLRNWIKTSSAEVVLSHEVVHFSSEVKEACRLYGVHYLWFSWLYYVNDKIIFDYESLNQLSRVFTSFLQWIAHEEITFQQIAEQLRIKFDIPSSLTSIKAEPIHIKEVYEQQLQSTLNIQKNDEESVVLMYHLLSIAEIPAEINLQNTAYAGFKTWGQQYLDYFFAKKMLSIENDVNTDHYLRLATRLGCQPSLKQWDEFIDQMLLCRDEERCEEDERILLGFVRELKMKMKSVMHHKDNKDRKIVEKIAQYIVKHQGVAVVSRKETYEKLNNTCPEVEWYILLSIFTPKELPESDKSSRQEHPTVSLSGTRFLPGTVYNQLFDANQHTFSPQESNHKGGVNIENGRHTVGFVQNRLGKNILCFKMNPEFPMIEQAGLELMYGLFGYPGIPFSEVMKWNVDRQRGEGSSLFLVSAYVEGIRADEVFSNADHADMINKLDEQRVGELIIYSILSNPEDGRLQNYIFVRSDRNASLYKIVAIDIDHSFAAAIPQKLPGWFSKETKTSSMLFTLPLMSEPIAESIQERLRKLDVDELFEGWLDDLERLEHEYRKLYNENEEERAEYETTTTLTLPMNYARLMHVYWKLKELKSFVMDYERTDETPQPTYMEALKRVEKYTGDRYEAVNESTLSVGERFKKSDGELSSSMIRGDFRDYALRFNEKKKGSGLTALETIAQVRISLGQKKQQHPKDIEEFEKIKEEFKRLSAAEQEELFVSYQSRITTLKEEEGTKTRTSGGKGRGKALDGAEIERKWLDLVSECVCEWQRLIIRHNGVLRKSWFVDAPKTAFYNLTLLELHDCSEVTGEVLDILSSQKSCRLEGVILSSLENLRTLCARGVLGRQTNNPLELPDLRSIRFVKNNNLKRIHINSTKLRHLVIEDCSHIERMSFGDISQLKSLQYDDITIQQNGDVRNLTALNIEFHRIFSAIKVASDSATLKNDTRNFQKLLDLFRWFCSITSAEYLAEEHSRITLITSDNLNIIEVIRELDNYKNLVTLNDVFLTINRPSLQILQSSYINIITLFKNNNPNPQIIKNEIDNYLRIESLYEQFLKDEDTVRDAIVQRHHSSFDGARKENIRGESTGEVTVSDSKTLKIGLPDAKIELIMGVEGNNSSIIEKGPVDQLINVVPTLSNEHQSDFVWQTLNLIRWSEINIEKKHLLGQGSFAIVVQAKWQRGLNNKIVAIKLMTESERISKNRDYEQDKERLIEEFKLLQTANLRNVDNIIRVHGFIDEPLPQVIADKLPCAAQEHEPAVGIVMEYIGSDTLSTLLYPKPSSPKLLLAIENKIHILLEIAKALADLHSIGLIHCDMKPQNILLSSDKPAPMIKVIDFGLTKFRANAVTQFYGASTIVNTVTLKGTMYYCAPEMLKVVTSFEPSLSSSRSTDMYAFGILSWEVLTGQKPFEKDNNFPRAVVEQGMRPPLSSLPADTPASVTRMIECCWDQERTKRKSAVECVSILSRELEIIKGGRFDLFFSHAWLNKPILSHVYRILVKAGLRVWYDQNEIGLQLNESMVKGISNSTATLVCLNRHFLSRENCLFELKEARRQNKPIFVLKLESDLSGVASDIDELLKEILKKNIFVDITTVAAREEWTRNDTIEDALMNDLVTGLEPLITLIQRELFMKKGADI